MSAVCMADQLETLLLQISKTFFWPQSNLFISSRGAVFRDHLISLALLGFSIFSILAAAELLCTFPIKLHFVFNNFIGYGFSLPSHSSLNLHATFG